MLEQFSLKGRVAAVTGASRGIGYAIALGLAEAGADMALMSRTENALGLVSASIEKRGRQCVAVAGDVGKEPDVKHFFDTTKSEYGRIDVLVNCAGISPYMKPAEELSDTEWNDVINVNLTGTFRCCREAAKVMLTQGSGSIINLASMGSYVGLRNASAYVASKGGVQLLTRTLAVEWAQRGIRVNAIAPGFIDTDMLSFLRNDEGAKQRILNSTPMGRLAPPDELVGAVIYLASDASRFVTGETIVIDGGYLAL
jgi:NAD(P)-dependent dehydrogenase (short-subunit alcohol dehydrogenase family)